MKIYERIVKSTFEPNKNDLWLKPGEGGSITMYEYNGGEWLPVGAAGGSDSGGGGCDCDTSDFVRTSDLMMIFKYPQLSEMVEGEYDSEHGGTAYYYLLEDDRFEARYNLMLTGVIGAALLTDNGVVSDIYDGVVMDRLLNNTDYFANYNESTLLYPMLEGEEDYMPEGITVPDGFKGWYLVAYMGDPI